MNKEKLEDYLDKYLTIDVEIEIAKEAKSIMESENILNSLNNIVEFINGYEYVYIFPYLGTIPIGICYAYNSIILRNLFKDNFFPKNFNSFSESELYDYLEIYLKTSGLYKYATRPNYAFKFNSTEERIEALDKFIKDLEQKKYDK